jgi:hypothetical protein
MVLRFLCSLGRQLFLADALRASGKVSLCKETSRECGSRVSSTAQGCQCCKTKPSPSRPADPELAYRVVSLLFRESLRGPSLGTVHPQIRQRFIFILFLIFILFICAYNVWVISPPFRPCPPFPPTSLPPLLPLTPCYQAETILPLSLILLKRAYKQ